MDNREIAREILSMGIFKTHRFKRGDNITTESNKGYLHIGEFKEEAPNEGLNNILVSNAVFYIVATGEAEESPVSRVSNFHTRLSTDEEIAIYKRVQKRGRRLQQMG